MVKIFGFVKRKNKEDVEFNALLLESGFELVKSKESDGFMQPAKGLASPLLSMTQPVKI